MEGSPRLLTLISAVCPVSCSFEGDTRISLDTASFRQTLKIRGSLELSHSRFILLVFLRIRLACERGTLTERNRIKAQSDDEFTPEIGRGFEIVLKRFQRTHPLWMSSLKRPLYRSFPHGDLQYRVDQEGLRRERPGAAFFKSSALREKGSLTGTFLQQSHREMKMCKGLGTA